LRPKSIADMSSRSTTSSPLTQVYGAGSASLTREVSPHSSHSGWLTTSGHLTQVYADGPMHFKSREVTEDYDISETILGEGVSGQVRTAGRKYTRDRRIAEEGKPGLKYAIKTMTLQGVEEDKLEAMRKEVDVLMRMDHPNIISLLDVYETDGSINIVTEILEGGDLCDKYNEVGRFPEEEAAHAMWQMMLAVHYVHLQGVVHRDVKLEHFMYETKESKHLKLIDFGLSDRWEQSQSLMDKTVGTLGWAAPEVLKKSYTSKCDVWGLGCIAFTLLLGFAPFSTKPSKETLHSVLNGEYRVKEGMWDWVSSEAGDFIRQLLTVDVDKRPSVRQALKHPWITQWNFESVEKNVTIVENVLDALENWSHASNVTKSCMQLAARCLPSERQQEFRDMFLALDVDKNGTLCLSEVMSQSILDTDAPRLFAELTTDRKDGDELHYTDFLAAMIAKTTERSDPIYKEALDRFAVNYTEQLNSDYEDIFHSVNCHDSNEKKTFLDKDSSEAPRASFVAAFCKNAARCFKPRLCRRPATSE